MPCHHKVQKEVDDVTDIDDASTDADGSETHACADSDTSSYNTSACHHDTTIRSKGTLDMTLVPTHGEWKLAVRSRQDMLTVDGGSTKKATAKVSFGKGELQS